MPSRFVHLLAPAIVCLAVAPAAAQLTRLPAAGLHSEDAAPSEVYPATPGWQAEPPYPGRLVSHPDSAASALERLESLVADFNPDRPVDSRDGMFQKLRFESAWIAPGCADGFGMSTVELQTVLGLPIPSRRSPMVITPGFTAHWLDGPTVPDLPPRLYEAYAQVRWWKRFSRGFGIDFSITPGVFSDFQQGTDEAIRTPGHVAAVLEFGPRLKLIGGVAYLDRDDVNVLGIGGLVWTPGPDVRYELVFPKPKIARRIRWLGGVTDECQDWLYLAGEFGGGTWAIRRADGSDDRFTYRDFRVLLGVERKRLFGVDGRVELGYVFGREISFAGGTPDFEPCDTFMVRAAADY